MNNRWSNTWSDTSSFEKHMGMGIEQKKEGRFKKDVFPKRPLKSREAIHQGIQAHCPPASCGVPPLGHWLFSQA